MSNRRMINSDLFEDNDIGILDIFKRYLWIGLITSAADDQGRLIDNPAIIKAKIFPYDTTISDQEVEGALLAFSRSIHRYTKDGKKLLQILNWWKYQTPSWAAPSKFPAPDGWIDRVKIHIAGNKVRTENWDQQGGFVGSVLGTPLPTLVHSPVHTPVHIAIEEIEGECECDGEGENEEELAPDSFSNTQRTIEQITGIPAVPGFTTSINEIIQMGALPADIQAGYNWLKDQGKAVKYYGSLVGPTRTAMSRRLGNDHPAREHQITEEELRASIYI